MSSDDRTINEKILDGHYHADFAGTPFCIRPARPQGLTGKAHNAAMLEFMAAEQRVDGARNELARKQAALDAEFKADLLAHLGITDHPKADLLFQMAKVLGEDEGPHEILRWASSLAELLR